MAALRKEVPSIPTLAKASISLRFVQLWYKHHSLYYTVILKCQPILPLIILNSLVTRADNQWGTGAIIILTSLRRRELEQTRRSKRRGKERSIATVSTALNRAITSLTDWPQAVPLQTRSRTAVRVRSVGRNSLTLLTARWGVLVTVTGIESTG